MPIVTPVLVALNILVYLLELASGGTAFCYAHGLVPAHFVPETLVSSMFLHDPGTLFHIGGNMAFLLVFGTVVEGSLGGLGFLVVYFASGALGGLFHVAIDPTSVVPLVGASGAIAGVLALASVINPRLIGFAAAFTVTNVWNALSGGAPDVSFATHIAGFSVGAAAALMLRVMGSEALEAA